MVGCHRDPPESPTKVGPPPTPARRNALHRANDGIRVQLRARRAETGPARLLNCFGNCMMNTGDN